MSRIAIAKTNKLGYAAVIGLEGYVRSTVDAELYELIKLRASVLNGCGFCVDMHATDGARRGISQRRLHAVAAWRHARSLFDERETAVLALTDAVTRLGPDGVDDEVWDAAARHFDDGQLGAIVLAIATINVWNRIAIATEMEPPVDAAHPVA
ncbi:alkyl hydroperoxide reductase AhpD [Microbacterium barkeri]|uniref:Alkyl hydroperoxide reductase AhpD n=1 Tax=Microbacterium barkeri TaxID=33917 RepID=A0A9W6H1G3_9MICO|nr:carboxymuconolactone decarboxylase family protein [Microbacterium barkeri]MDR6875363.1 AhpD family alkylhydroperoxidase [Microbacterium barkeri]GLJ60470.1 alkyl hydroperoxide reductase AhpD [Microbacterium barkeri]